MSARDPLDLMAREDPPPAARLAIQVLPAAARRMGGPGLELPPAKTLMPGPVATLEEARAAGAPA